MLSTSIFWAVKALTLSATLLNASSLRVAVTTISPTSVAPSRVDVSVAWGAVCAIATPDKSMGAIAVEAKADTSQACRLAM